MPYSGQLRFPETMENFALASDQLELSSFSNIIIINILNAEEIRYLRLFHSHDVHIIEIERPQFLSLPVDDVKRCFRTKFHFYQATMIRVQPFSHDHFIDAYASVVSILHRFLKNFQTSSSTVLKFYETVCNTRTNDRYEAEKDTSVDVGEFASLKKSLTDHNPRTFCTF